MTVQQRLVVLVREEARFESDAEAEDIICTVTGAMVHGFPGEARELIARVVPADLQGEGSAQESGPAASASALAEDVGHRGELTKVEGSSEGARRVGHSGEQRQGRTPN